MDHFLFGKPVGSSLFGSTSPDNDDGDDYDDDDVTDSSIYDLDHAPSPDRAFLAHLRGEVVSPQRPDFFSGSSSIHSPSNSFGASGRMSLRKRSNSQPSIMTSLSHPPQEGPEQLHHVRSFPPDNSASTLDPKDDDDDEDQEGMITEAVTSATNHHGRQSSHTHSNRKRFFASSRDVLTQQGMRDIPEVEEKEEERSDDDYYSLSSLRGEKFSSSLQEITLDGTEIDQAHATAKQQLELQRDRFDSSTSRYSESEYGVSEVGPEGMAVPDEEQPGRSVDAVSPPARVIFMGYEMPLWCSKRRISWNRTSCYQMINVAALLRCIRLFR
jgi:hypothetical protein